MTKPIVGQRNSTFFSMVILRLIDPFKACCSLALAACLSACLVSPDEMRQRGILGEMWQTANRVESGSTSQSDLFRATQEGELGKVLSALESGEDANSVNEQGQSLLSVAIAAGERELLAIFIQHGARISAEHYCEAISRQGADCLPELMTHRTELNQICGDRYTPLGKAVRWGDPEVVQSLLRLGAFTQQSDGHGRKPEDYLGENQGSFPDIHFNNERIRKLLADFSPQEDAL